MTDERAGLGHALLASASQAWRRGIASDVSSTMIGTVLGQIVLVAVSPVLTRLYSPAELGGFAVFLGLAATLSVVGALGYQLAIPLPTNRLIAANVTAVAVIALFVCSSIICLVAFGARWIGLTAPLGGLPWLLAPTVAAMSGFQILFMWTTREGDFRGAGVARLSQATAQALGQITAGLLRFGTAGLIAAYALAQFAGLGRLWRIARFPHSALSWGRMRAAALRYRKFPQLTMWGSLANSAGTQLPAVLVGSLYGLTIAGEFSLAMRVLALPAALLGQAFAQVFYPKAAARAERPEQLQQIVLRASGILLLGSLVCFVPIIALGGELFGLVFGARWEIAGQFGRWIAVWSAVALVSSPVSTLYLVVGRQGTGLIFSIADAIVKVLALVLGGWLGGAHMAIHAFAVTAAGSYLAFHVWTLRLVDLRLLTWLRGYWREAAATVVVLGLMLGLRTRMPVLILWAAGTTLIGLACWPSASRLLGEGAVRND